MKSNKTDDFFVDFDFGAHFIEKTGSVEGVFKERGIGHAKVFQDIVLNFGGGGGGKRDDGSPVYLLDDGAQAPVFGPKIMAPFGDAMGLVYGEERNVHRVQELGVFFLGKGFGGNKQHFGFTGNNVLLYPFPFAFREGAIEEMGYTSYEKLQKGLL
jgi:hypothetical protein